MSRDNKKYKTVDVLAAFLFTGPLFIIGDYIEMIEASYLSFIGLYIVSYIHVLTIRENKINLAALNKKEKEREAIEDERYLSGERNNLIDKSYNLTSMNNEIEFRIRHMLSIYHDKMSDKDIKNWKSILNKAKAQTENVVKNSDVHAELSNPMDINEINQCLAYTMNAIASAKPTVSMVNEKFNEYSNLK